MKFGEFLIQKGAITPAALDEALRVQAERTPHNLLGEVLVELGSLNARALFQDLLAFTRERGADHTTLKEWITQAEIDRLLAGGATPE